MNKKKDALWIAWVLIIPVLFIRGFTTIYPIFQTIKNSFYNIKLLQGVNYCWIKQLHRSV